MVAASSLRARQTSSAPATQLLRSHATHVPVHTARAGKQSTVVRPSASSCRLPLPSPSDDHRAGDADRDAAAALREGSTGTSPPTAACAERDPCSNAPNPHAQGGVTLDRLLDTCARCGTSDIARRGQRRTLNRLDRGPTKNGISLFTPLGRRTPQLVGLQASRRRPRTRRPRHPNVDLSAPVPPRTSHFAAARCAARSREPPSLPGARAPPTATSLLAEAQIGTSTVGVYRLILSPRLTTITNTIGRTASPRP